MLSHIVKFQAEKFVVLCTRAAMLGVCIAIVSCNSPSTAPKKNNEHPQLNASFEPLRAPKGDSATAEHGSEPAETQAKTQYLSGPSVKIARHIADAKTKEVNLNLTGAPLSVNYHDMPLPVFINQIFGEELGLSFNLDPQIQKQSDLVTLRVTDPIPPSELFKVALSTLASYGVSAVQDDKVLSFTIDKKASAGEIPLLISGQALPDVPESHRPVFLFIPLKTVTGSKVTSWLKDALQGKDFQVQDDPMRNALLLKGKPDVIAQAVQIVEVLDQPIMRGKYSTSIEPAFSKVADLSKNLKEVLNAEGYDAQIKSPTGAIIIIPLDGANQMVVFASSQSVLDHVREWVDRLDRRQQMSIDQGIFTYEVKNTDAEHIVDMLGGLDSGNSNSKTSGSSRKPEPAVGSGSAVSDKVANNAGSTSNSGTAGKLGDGSFVVDTNRNTIIYKGSGQSWADLLPVIRSLDKSAPSVLVEVLIAEVTLTNSENSGIEFLKSGTFKANGNTYPTSWSTLTLPKTSSDSAVTGLGLGVAGLSGVINTAGQTRAALNLFQQNKRAEIRSRPRIMVKSGQQATINVGQKIPVRGSVTTTGSSVSKDSVVQNIDSATTGVSLAVKPIVHASGNIDIEINSELSEATKTTVSEIDSPTIFNRKVKTTVTLKDGGSILIGGLISSNNSKTKTAVPKLGNIPLLGRLFRTDADATDRTELMIMIIPYVIDTPTEGEAITKTLQNTFQVE